MWNEFEITYKNNLLILNFFYFLFFLDFPLNFFGTFGYWKILKKDKNGKKNDYIYIYIVLL